MPKTIIILSDGTTWNTIDGCSICTITDEDFDKLCDDKIDAQDIVPVSEIGLKSYNPA